LFNNDHFVLVNEVHVQHTVIPQAQCAACFVLGSTVIYLTALVCRRQRSLSFPSAEVSLRENSTVNRKPLRGVDSNDGSKGSLKHSTEKKREGTPK
jgi:hypothetical protein